MAVLKMIIAYVCVSTLFVYVAADIQVHSVTNINGLKSDTPTSVPSEYDWILEAQKSIRQSMRKIKYHVVESSEIGIIVNGAFNAFTKFVTNGLSEVIEKMNNSTLDEINMLKTQLMNWSEGLERVNKVRDLNNKSAKIAMEKFIMTIDYIVSEDIVRLDKKFNFQSSEFKSYIDELKKLFKECVTELVKYAKSAEDQVSGFSKTN